MAKTYQKRINRWHDKQLDHLSFSINMVFTLSIALVGFIINVKDGSKQYKSCLIVLCLAIIIGTIALLSRYYDFKYTKDTIKIKKEKNKKIVEITGDTMHNSKVDSVLIELTCRLTTLRNRTKILGEITKTSFVIQILLLVIAIVFLVYN